MPYAQFALYSFIAMFLLVLAVTLTVIIGQRYKNSRAPRLRPGRGDKKARPGHAAPALGPLSAPLSKASHLLCHLCHRRRPAARALGAPTGVPTAKTKLSRYAHLSGHAISGFSKGPQVQVVPPTRPPRRNQPSPSQPSPAQPSPNQPQLAQTSSKCPQNAPPPYAARPSAPPILPLLQSRNPAGRKALSPHRYQISVCVCITAVSAAVSPITAAQKQLLYEPDGASRPLVAGDQWQLAGGN